MVWCKWSCSLCRALVIRSCGLGSCAAGSAIADSSHPYQASFYPCFQRAPCHRVKELLLLMIARDTEVNNSEVSKVPSKKAAGCGVLCVVAVVRCVLCVVVCWCLLLFAVCLLCVCCCLLLFAAVCCLLVVGWLLVGCWLVFDCL